MIFSGVSASRLRHRSRKEKYKMKIGSTATSLVFVIVVFFSLGPVVGAANEDSATSIPEMQSAIGRGPATEVNLPTTNGTARIQLLLNFQDTPVRTILDYLSERAGLMIVANTPLDGSITVISRQPIGVDQAIALINSVLRERDLVALRLGRTLKVFTLSKARTIGGLPVTSDHDLDDVDGGDDVVTHILTVRYVDAVALRQNLLPLLPETATIEANRDGNALIVTDTTSNIKRVMKIVQALDSRMATVAEIKVFRLTRAQATSTAQLINNIFQQDPQTTTARTGRQGNQRGRGGFDMMMQDGFDARGGRGFSQDQQTGGDQPTTTANARVVAAADERANAVVVRGPAEALKIVAGVIAGLDDSTAVMAGVRVFQLRYADALNVAQVVNQLFGQNRTSANSQQNNMPIFMRRGGGGLPAMDTQQNASGPALQVTAAADSRTNSVVVTGPDTILDVVEDTVKKLDAQIPNVADVQVFHLQYADATNTATLINDVFGTGRTSSSRSTARNSQQNQGVIYGMGGRGGMMGGQMMGNQPTPAGTSSDVTVVASADTRTNSVVVSGPPETLKIVGDIVTDLDQNPEQERRIFVYPLKNAVASNLMTVLNNLFTQMRTLNQQGTSSRTAQQYQGGAATQRNAGPGGGTAAAGAAISSASDTGANNNDLSDETYFQADTTTNSLLVLTSTKNYTRVKPIIDDLDKPVGQVLIKVLFAEITHSDSIDLGTEFSMINLRSSGGSTTTNTVFGTPGAGLSVHTVEGDLDITLSALQKVGKLNVLSRPYVLTSNNQAATMSVAQEVPIPTGSTTVAGQTQTTVEYRNDIGIVLTVTPQINPDGLVNMTINPKITTIGADKVKVSETLDALTFATRSATTKVAVHNGQTIVIGGLIEDQVTDTISKVPVLGDVPLLGVLYSRTVHDKAKTELLIFLTPLVAEEAHKLTAISGLEQDGTELSNDKDASEAFRRHVKAMRARPDPNKP
jgi:general secretion pathway protein D